VSTRPRLVGINHVALEVGDLEAAIDFYTRVFDLGEVSRMPGAAFLRMGDQFINLSEGRTAPPDEQRHFGLVVDDKEVARAALAEAGAEIRAGRFLDAVDPWGNLLQIVDYRDIQFSKTPAVLRAMGLDELRKRPAALDELRERGMLDAD
jgi:catechol 2,3-dioxygenase-like lactoylglutathione lyase family enzyme